MNLLPSNRSPGIFTFANFPILTKVNLLITDTPRDFETEKSTE